MKRVLLICFVIINLMLFSAVIFAAEKADVKIGDADLNGVVNVKDATLVQKHVAGIVHLQGDALALADADGNGTVNVKDATLIQKFVAGIVSDFPQREEPSQTTTQSPSSVVTETKEVTVNPTEVTETDSSQIVTQAPTTTAPTQTPTKPSVDSDGYFDTVIRP